MVSHHVSVCVCVAQVPLGPAGDALVKSINATAAVETVVPDVCVKAMDCE
jgi:hypothetical protein